jgi:hypothetical protein
MPWSSVGGFATCNPGVTLIWTITPNIVKPDGNSPFLGPIGVAASIPSAKNGAAVGLAEDQDTFYVGSVTTGDVTVKVSWVPVGDFGEYILSYQYTANTTNNGPSPLVFNLAIGTF